MGKQGSPRSPRPESQNVDATFRMKDNQIRFLETLSGNDPSIGRRMSGGDYHWNKTVVFNGLKNDSAKYSASKGKRHVWLHKHVRSIAFMFLVMGFFFLLDSLMVSLFHSMNLHNSSTSTKPSWIKEDSDAYSDEQKSPVQMYSRLLSLASSALAEKEFKNDASNFWEEPYQQASVWKPCADRRTTDPGKSNKSNGFILVSANGGLNQQRVAICNAVAVASLLNASLVLPNFLYSNVWKDPRFKIVADFISMNYFQKFQLVVTSNAICNVWM